MIDTLGVLALPGFAAALGAGSLVLLATLRRPSRSGACEVAVAAPVASGA